MRGKTRGAVLLEVPGRYEVVELDVEDPGSTLYQKRLQGSLFGAGAPRAAIPEQLRLWREGKLKLDELVTTRYGIDDVAQGFADMHAGRNLRRVVVFDV
ncbi:MAG: hypothetical protein JOY78_00585 [Pseudonocardia sp.]|nr:hypothetical protein [Pseudonocardia sp.]